MNRRLKLSDIADYLRPLIQAEIPECHVGTGFDPEYMNQYPNLLPAVWVYGQTSTPADDGTGFTGNFSQKVNCDLYFRLSVQRYVEGENDPEENLTTLHDLVSDAIKDWTPPNASKPLVWVSSKDGPTADSLLAADLVFRTQVRYQRPTS